MILAASPGDFAPERKLTREILYRANRSITRNHGVIRQVHTYQIEEWRKMRGRRNAMAVLHINQRRGNPSAGLRTGTPTGLSMTTVVRESLRERLAREQAADSGQERKLARILEIARRCAARPVLDGRSPEEILGYDENGLPR